MLMFPPRSRRMHAGPASEGTRGRSPTAPRARMAKSPSRSRLGRDPFLLDGCAHGQHDHWPVPASARIAPSMSRPVLPAEQVEQHERVVAGQRGGLAALTVVADGDGVPFGPQALLDEARRCPLVLA